jgi:protein-L-isoaspartate(D-aspartate) O-methyltransferase
LTHGVARHGPYDAILVEGGVETVPETLTDQLKEGGRIVAIFGDGHKGQARIGLKSKTGMVWRRAFDATAPVLGGFTLSKEFEF